MNVCTLFGFVDGRISTYKWPKILIIFSHVVDKQAKEDVKKIQKNISSRNTLFDGREGKRYTKYYVVTTI